MIEILMMMMLLLLLPAVRSFQAFSSWGQ